MEDLLNEPDEEISWIVDGMLPSGGFSLVVAKPKVGKSTIVRQLALAVVRGDTFLGLQTAKGPVLYVSLEEKRSEVRKHFRLMGGEGVKDLGVYVGSTPKEAFEWLKTEVERKKPVLVIMAVKDLARHKSERTTLQNYAGVDKERSKAIHGDIMNGLFG